MILYSKYTLKKVQEELKMPYTHYPHKGESYAI